MKYVHVVIPLNITPFFTQAEILQDIFLHLTQQTTSDKRNVSFTKVIRDAGVYEMKKLSTIAEKIRKPGQQSTTQRHKEPQTKQ